MYGGLSARQIRTGIKGDVFCYLIVYTSFTVKEVHLPIQTNKREFLSVVKELGYKLRLVPVKQDDDNWREGT